jgi:hypothetical protein
MNKELADKACQVLNEAYNADPDAIRIWLCQMVKVNEAVANHPTIVVGQLPVKWTLGPLGMINGIVETLSGYLLASKWSDVKPGDPAAFEGFVVVDVAT